MDTPVPCFLPPLVVKFLSLYDFSPPYKDYQVSCVSLALVFLKVALALKIAVSPLPTGFSVHTPRLLELTFAAIFGSVHKGLAAEWRVGVGLAFRALRVNIGQVGGSLVEVFLKAHR